MNFYLKIIGAPIGKERPRFARIPGGVRTYTPSKTRCYEDEIKIRAKLAMSGKEIFKSAVAVDISAYFPIPKSWPKKKKVFAASWAIPVLTKPDLDNIAKLILDSLNGIVYLDDKQVVSLKIIKEYTSEEDANVVIRIKNME